MADPMVDRLRLAGCVFAEEEAAVLRESAVDAGDLERLVAARVAGAPLEPLVGWAAFAGLRIAIDPGVFVPRLRTEALVDVVLRALEPAALVVDLCCGSGAIGAAIAAARPDVTVFGADLDPVAVRCARRNLPADRVFEGDLLAALPPALAGAITAIVVNAPYVPSHAIRLMPPEAREHEPHRALDGGTDGLDLHRRIAADAGAWLAPHGTVVIETSSAQQRGTATALRVHGFAVHAVHDDARDSTVVVGRLRGDAPLPGGRSGADHQAT